LCYPEEASSVLRAAKAAPANNRAIAIVLVDPGLGLKGGFEMARILFCISLFRRAG